MVLDIDDIEKFIESNDTYVLTNVEDGKKFEVKVDSLLHDDFFEYMEIKGFNKDYKVDVYISQKMDINTETKVSSNLLSMTVNDRSDGICSLENMFINKNNERIAKVQCQKEFKLNTWLIKDQIDLENSINKLSKKLKETGIKKIKDLF